MYKLANINNSYESYQSLISFYNCYKNAFLDEIHLGLYMFFAANMSAALGATFNY